MNAAGDINHCVFVPGHESEPVLLPGFVIKWEQNQITTQAHLFDLTIMLMWYFSVSCGCQSPTLHHRGWRGTASRIMALDMLAKAGDVSQLRSVSDRLWLAHHRCPLSHQLWPVSVSWWRHGIETLHPLWREFVIEDSSHKGIVIHS